MDAHKVGAFIAKLRKEKGLTQSGLAEILNISNRTVSKWENGDGYPDITLLFDVAESLGVTVDELLNGERDEKKNDEILFEDYCVTKRKDFIKAIRLFQSRKIPLYVNFSIKLFSVPLLLSLRSIGSHLNNGILIDKMNRILLAYFIFLAIHTLLIILYPYIVYNNTNQSSGGKDVPSTLTISNKTINYERGIKHYSVSLDEITEFVMDKNYYLILCGKKILFTINKSDIKDNKAFEALIKAHANNVITPKKSVEGKILSVFLIVASLFLIFITALTAYYGNSSYFYSNIEDKKEYYYDNLEEFNNALNETQQFYIDNKQKIDKEINDEEYADYYEKDFRFKLYKIQFVNYFPDTISFDTDEVNITSGYFYSNINKPKLSDLSYDSEYYDKLEETYSEEDGIYLYGKTKNGTLSKDSWYLIAPLDDNWYYYEVHY